MKLYCWQVRLIFFNTSFSYFFILSNLQTVDISPLDFQELIHTLKVCNIACRKACRTLVKYGILSFIWSG